MARRKRRMLNTMERDVEVRKLMMRQVTVNDLRRIADEWARDLTAESVAYHGAELVVARMTFQEWLDWQLRLESGRIAEQIKRLHRMPVKPLMEPTDEGAA